MELLQQRGCILLLLPLSQRNGANLTLVSSQRIRPEFQPSYQWALVTVPLPHKLAILAFSTTLVCFYASPTSRDQFLSG